MKTGRLHRAVTVVVCLVTALLLVSSPSVAEDPPQPGGKNLNEYPGEEKCGQTRDLIVNAGAVLWCFPWAGFDDIFMRDDKAKEQYENTPMQSWWYTLCSRAEGIEEKNRCAAATLTIADPPPDGKKGDSRASSTVFIDKQRKESEKPIHCEWFGRKGDENPDTKAAWQGKQGKCTGFETYYLTGLYEHTQEDLEGFETSKNGECGTAEIECKIGKAVSEAIEKGIRSGLQGLVDAAVQAMVFLLGKMATLVFDSTSPDEPNESFYIVYNIIAGFMIVLVLLFFFIATITNNLRFNGPGPVWTLGGLVRAVLGIVFAGGIAWTITLAWDEATAALIDTNSATQYDPSLWITAMTNLAGAGSTMLFAFFIAVVSIIGLALLFIVMLFRGILVVAAALFGPMAMAGQVMPETRSWGRKWFWTVNALASSKFFIAALWIYGTRATYEADNFLIAIQGLLIIWLMVACPAVLLRLTSMWDGYLSDVNAQGIASSIGREIGSLTGKASGQNSPGGDSSAPHSPVGLMNGNLGDIPTLPKGSGGGDKGPNMSDNMASAVRGAGQGQGQRQSSQKDGGKPSKPSGGGDDSESGPHQEEANATDTGMASAKSSLSRGQVSPSPSLTGHKDDASDSPSSSQTGESQGQGQSGSPSAAPKGGGSTGAGAAPAGGGAVPPPV